MEFEDSKALAYSLIKQLQSRLADSEAAMSTLHSIDAYNHTLVIQA